MKIFFRDQKGKLHNHLEYLKSSSVMSYDRSQLKENVTTIDLQQKWDKIDFQVLFDYKIFPENIMTFFTEWEAEERAMNIGDIIVQQVHLPPIKLLSQKLIFGVRVKELFDQPDKKGFSYETLDGHVEKGISTFTIERKDETVIFKIQTYSAPGSFLIKLVAPIFSSPYQAFCTKKALRNVKNSVAPPLTHEE